MFIVEELETIEQCLARMMKEGYSPVRRIEEPIFQEIVEDGQKQIVPCGRIIKFEGKIQK
ncbi:NETI motif-containing protein [Bacillus sp. HMF5848]|uniref:NETI motif-containing protein n=1 Tax=Bacillus sp. HMF5848 TaxID=2495421 RepID=UPI000F767D4E|nr:NETI motif-containing protein [Bacillus sp. HMF5848]RSK25745.1 NETI motif-containing protein [Bacillus sp. HMF5848]